MELAAANTAPTLGPKTQSLLHGEVVIRPDLNSSLSRAFHVYVLLMLSARCLVSFNHCK